MGIGAFGRVAVNPAYVAWKVGTFGGVGGKSEKSGSICSMWDCRGEAQISWGMELKLLPGVWNLGVLSFDAPKDAHLPRHNILCCQVAGRRILPTGLSSQKNRCIVNGIPQAVLATLGRPLGRVDTLRAVGAPRKSKTSSQQKESFAQRFAESEQGVPAAKTRHGR